MNGWQASMRRLVSRILNRGDNEVYSLEFVSANRVLIYKNGYIIMTRTTNYDIASHWKSEAREIILSITEDKIKSLLLSV